MTDPENVLARWSRRKSDARAGERDVGPAPHDNDAGTPGSGSVVPSDISPPVDLASLPALDSITSETSLRAFLDKGVPAELTAAALRRGWSADPAIRDFVGLSENSWDFNAPGGISGFGPLAPENIRKLLAQMIEGAEEVHARPDSGAPSSDEAAPQTTEHPVGQDVSASDVSISSHQDARTQQSDSAHRVATDGVNTVTPQATRDHDIHRPSRPQRHGGALPRFDVD
jgi:hypothetical protein